MSLFAVEGTGTCCKPRLSNYFYKIWVCFLRVDYISVWPLSCTPKKNYEGNKTLSQHVSQAQKSENVLKLGWRVTPLALCISHLTSPPNKQETRQGSEIVQANPLLTTWLSFCFPSNLWGRFSCFLLGVNWKHWNHLSEGSASRLTTQGSQASPDQCCVKNAGMVGGVGPQFFPNRFYKELDPRIPKTRCSIFTRNHSFYLLVCKLCPIIVIL